MNLENYRKSATRTTTRGFSLVELVIVIVIIGVLAAIAIPRVGRGAKGAGESALSNDLSVLRNVVELYAGEHNGDYPGVKGDGTNAANTAGAVVSQLTKYSDVNGGVADARDATHLYGPYLRKGLPPAPVGANAGDDTVAIDAMNSPPAVTAGTEGWVYNPNTGDIIVNSSDKNNAGTLTFDQY